MSKNLIGAILWAIHTANDASHGYDQQYRLGQRGDYDCSSFVAAALRAGGFTDVPATMWTGNELTSLQNAGFVSITPIGNPKAGDVFFWHSGTNGHTCISISAADIAQATINELGTVTGGTPGDQTGQEICISPWYNSPWGYQMRYVEQLTWISSNAALTQAQMENNATIICNLLIRQGWSPEAIAALLGNMQQESTINPGVWENFDSSDPNNGFGLVQWTPSTNYTDWAALNGWANDDGDGQMTWILTETVNSGQWIPTVDYPMSWADWTTSTDTPANLALAFLANFERGDPNSASIRAGYANAWYTWMGGQVFTGCPPWLLFKFVEKRRRLDGRSI